jgi:parallel beta-helix repeat protein
MSATCSIRVFTVRDFGIKATTETEWGSSNLIHLENAEYNTIEHNQLINGDMMGIMLVDSGNNTVQHNTAFVEKLWMLSNA